MVRFTDYSYESVCMLKEKDSITRAMVGNYLPEDVLVEVLARLPVKSLLRFKCVSKSWRDILKDPSFITKHYVTRATSNHGSTVLTGIFNTEGFDQFALMSDDAQAIKFTYLDLPFFKEELNEPGPDPNIILEVAGPINGIVLVSNILDGLYLWNPATRKFKALPCSSTPCSLPDKFIRHSCRVGFGIDPITNDYKVVRIWFFYRYDGEIMHKVELLSLSADSCKPCSITWKIIDAILPAVLRHPHYYYPSDAVYLKGKYYWCTEMSCFRKGWVGIVWFDLGNEVFGLIELSEVRSDLMDNMYFRRLVVMKDSIAMIRYTHKVDENFFYKIWIMNECDTGVSWTYYATIGPLPISHVPLGLWKGDELVLNTGGDLVMIHIPSGEVLSYDTKTHETKDTINRIFSNEDFPLANYNESLVSVIEED